MRPTWRHRLTAFAAAFTFAIIPNAAHAIVATFSIRLEDKLFIAPIPVATCGPLAVVGPSPTAIAAYVTFCQATSALTSENPPNGAMVAPLDARIRSGADVIWRCDTNALPAPIGPTAIAALGTVGGPEGPGLTGVVNPTVTRDQIAANGTWGAVISGHPHPLVEPGFQALRLRASPDIWNRLRGAITCGVDARGMPTSTVNLNLLSTQFPSHRVWYRTPIRAPGPGARIFNVPQGSFSALWFLPVPPAP